MRQLSILSLFLLLQLSAWAQTGRRVVIPLAEAASTMATTETARLPFAGAEPFFSYFVEWPEGELEAHIRFSTDGANWTNWQSLERDEHAIDKGSSLLYIGEPAYRYYEFEAEGTALGEANLHFFHPKQTGHFTPSLVTAEARDLLACPCPLPEFQDRSEWCPAGDCTIQGAPVATEVSHIIIHHSAGPNDLTDWAAYMRSVWDFHVNGRGWDDVGYNWLIDPNGVIYQGRGDNIRGAHFCGQNTGTMGVCMMGDYTDRQPTLEARASLEALLSWKSCDLAIDPLATAFHASSGLNLKRISGHRDGCSTACPGDDFYPLMNEVRQGVADHIDNNCAYEGPLVLSSTAVDDSTFQLSWTYNGEETLDSFFLEKAVGGEPADFMDYQRFSAATLSFTEADLDADGIFRYRLRALTTTQDTTEYSNTLLINTTIVGQESLTLPAHALQVSPNPVSQQATVSLHTPAEGELELELLNVQGQVLRHWHAHKHGSDWSTSYDWSDLPAGMYFLRAHIGGQYGVVSVIKGE